ncbi:MAG: hypothetical protein OXC62_00955 [Aestuariivita sp.]|nr:hypothetical protein [Aestuariivita sp.]
MNATIDTRTHIFFLCKFFENESYATDFMKGQLYANKLSYFQRLEESSNVRGDTHEGIISWQQPEMVKIIINGIDISNDLAGPAFMSSNRLREFNVICMHAGYVENYTDCSIEDLEQIRKRLLIPEECKKFGEIAVVITNQVEFFKRIKAKADSCEYGFARSLVEYYDPNIFHGHFHGIMGAFKKQAKFRFEREYRIVFETGSIGDKPIKLDIGDIEDIAMRINIDEINRNMTIVESAHQA